MTAVIPAAGVGKRFGGNVKKQFAEFNGRPVLYYALKCLRDAFDFDEFLIGAGGDDFDTVKEAAEPLGISYRMVKGGDERWKTVLNCLLEVRSTHVLIHDAVRPFVPAEVTRETISTALESGACICCVPVRETLKRITADGIEGTVDRNRYVLSHTPQVFELRRLLAAVMDASRQRLNLTDESMAMEMAGHRVRYVQSTPENIKITYSSDIELVKSLMSKYHGNI
ncbi:MAG: 2-C-methyl-D-erythritol 4-phosphate cytidylyltransferase [Deferribacterales bacterium]